MELRRSSRENKGKTSRFADYVLETIEATATYVSIAGKDAPINTEGEDITDTSTEAANPRTRKRIYRQKKAAQLSSTR